MTDRKTESDSDTQAVTLKKDAIQLDNDCVYLYIGLSTRRNISHVYDLSPCLPAFNLTVFLFCGVIQTAN